MKSLLDILDQNGFLTENMNKEVINDEEKVIDDITQGRTLYDYQLMEKLGEGAQGEVWKAKLRSTGQIIALKILNIDVNNSKLNGLMNEISALEKISKPCHPFLSCYYSHFYDTDEGKLLIEMEYIDGEELGEWVQKFWNNNNFSALQHNLVHLTKDLARALKYIHSHGLIHRDIKPSNILITKDNIPKLVDFGIACDVKICNFNLPPSIGQCCEGYVGTPMFISPEVIDFGISYPVSDVWSLGATLFYLATATQAFDFMDLSSVENIMLTISQNEPFKLNTLNPLLNDIVNNSLIKPAENRMTVDELINLISYY